jgi:hypothetical protein
MTFTSSVAAAALASSLALCGFASAQMLADPHAPGYAARYPRSGGSELEREIARLDAVIRAVQNDRRDDGGYRARAVRDLTAAREELRRAIAWDRGHGGRVQP